MEKIYIHTPYIKDMGNGLTRLYAHFSEPYQEHDLFIEVENKWATYLCDENADAFVVLALSVALHKGWQIESEAPVTDYLLHNLNEELLPTLAKNDARCKGVKILAKPIREVESVGNGVGTAATRGVDSTYTIKKYTETEYESLKLTHLFVSSVSKDLWDYDEEDNLFSWMDKHNNYFVGCSEVEAYTKLPIVTQFNNFIKWMRDYSIAHITVHEYITLASVIALRKLWKAYIFSATFDFSEFSLTKHLSEDMAHYEVLVHQALSAPNFMCYTGGGTIDRVDKTVELGTYPLAQKMLHPCFQTELKNCSSPMCSKCLRALLTFDYYDMLDGFTQVFDIERYKNQRSAYLRSLIRNKDVVYFRRLYKMFSAKYPNEMKRLEGNVEFERIQREEAALRNAYEISMLLLKDENPQQAVQRFFDSRNIKTLYVSGNSRWGAIVLQYLEGIEIFNKNNGEICGCDAVFLLQSNLEDIEKFSNLISENYDGPIYSLVDLKNYLVKYRKNMRKNRMVETI